MMQRTAINSTLTALLAALLAMTALPLAAEDSAPVVSEDAPAAATATPAVESAPIVPVAEKPLDTEMEDVKKALLKLKRDLVILEEDLLFPASSQVAVFLSMDLGEFFQLDAVSLNSTVAKWPTTSTRTSRSTHSTAAAFRSCTWVT